MIRALSWGHDSLKILEHFVRSAIRIISHEETVREGHPIQITKPTLHGTIPSAWTVFCLLFLMACSNRPTEENDTIPAAVRAYARARCQRLEACECKNANHADREQCEDSIVALYLDAVAGRTSAELGCFGEAAQLWEHAPCDEPPSGEACNVLTRADAVGTSCRFHPFRDDFLRADSCAEGLFCWNDMYCARAPDMSEEGEPCSAEGLCGSGLTCIAGQCEQHRGEGEPCESSPNCAPARELYCGDGVCTMKSAPGGSCETREACRFGAQCAENRCVAIDPVICFAAEF